ncbi:MAG: hypothetical protein J0H39_14020 [Alphaproteobacteria bacterium]|nr:hypothetical protein [Alphaproteobacteria bacterium]
MDPITIALGLAQFVPTAIRWISGDDKSKAADAADKLIGVAKSVTGKPDGAAALAAIQADPALALKMQESWNTHEAFLWREETDRLKAVNETMRAESTSVDPWQRRWRPFWGFAAAVQFNICATGIIGLAIYAVAKRDVEMIRALPDIITAMALLFSIPGAILGVASWMRGRTQLEQAKR